MIAGPGGDADERESVRQRRRRDGRHRTVATRHAQRVRATLKHAVDRSVEVLMPAEEHDLDPSFASPLGDPSPRGDAAAGLRVHEEHRPLRRLIEWDGARQVLLTRRLSAATAAGAMAAPVSDPAMTSMG
jgi:hypothetical protein